MTATELEQLFSTQLATGPKKVFYMTQQGGPEITQIQASVLSHDTEAGTWDDLLASLAGYTYQDSVGNANWPRFKKD